jgi:hypothetical protein
MAQDQAQAYNRAIDDAAKAYAKGIAIGEENA